VLVLAYAQGDKMDSRDRVPTTSASPKKAWEPPTLSYVGDVEDVIQGGEGKLSNAAADPGEPKKEIPSG
jgi:hypothetical protein